jgi:Ner family transcriptional regulator
MNQDMAPEKIKKLIIATGITLSELGIQNGFSHAAVSIALRKRSPFVQEVIARKIGMRPQDVWPSRYDENGSPLRLDPRGRRRPIPGTAGKMQRQGRTA